MHNHENYPQQSTLLCAEGNSNGQKHVSSSLLFIELSLSFFKFIFSTMQWFMQHCGMPLNAHKCGSVCCVCVCVCVSQTPC